ncbi:MAG: hypothetical protein ABMA00_08935, partial [Gemmatimonas sp.]
MTTSRSAPSVSLVPDNRELAERYAAIAEELAANPASADRDRVKQDIIALFRDADAALRRQAAFKESVKALVSQWKQLDGAHSPAPAAAHSAPAAERPVVSGRVDHLGASTFVEKGWSKLSLGDAAGAEVALRRALEFTPGDNEAETLLGWAQMMQQQYDSALLTFHNVLMRDPLHALARTN